MKTKPNKVQLGDRVKDKISGVEGIVWGISKWLTGCNHIGIRREGLTKDEKPHDTVWVDEPMVEIISKAAVLRDEVNPVEPETGERKGGPLPTGVTYSR